MNRVKSGITGVLTLVVAICGLSVFGASVGDTLTFSNASLSGSRTVGEGSYGDLRLTVPASADLPVGSTYKIKTVKLALRDSETTAYNYLVFGSGSTYASASKAIDTTTSFCGKKSVTYTFTSSTAYEVGTAYIGYLRDANTGSATGQTKGFALFQRSAGDPQVIQQTNNAIDTYTSIYELTVEVVSVAAASDIISVNFGTKSLAVGKSEGKVGGVGLGGWQDIVGANSTAVNGTRNLLDAQGATAGRITVSAPQNPWGPTAANMNTLANAIEATYLDLSSNNSWSLNLATDYLCSKVNVYLAGDGGTFSPLTVNSNTYTGGVNQVVGTDVTSWGSRWYNQDLDEKCVVTVGSTVGGTYAISSGSSSNRNTLGGLQVVDTSSSDAYNATVSGSAATTGDSAVTWTKGTATSTLANITAADDRILSVTASGDSAALAFSGETIRALEVKSGTLTISGAPTIGTILVRKNATLIVSGGLGDANFTLTGLGTINFTTTHTVTSGKTVTVNGAVKCGGLTFASGSDISFGALGSIEIPQGKTIEWQNTFANAKHRALLAGISGAGTLKVKVGSTNEAQIHSDSTSLTVNVNVEYTGGGEIDLVGTYREATDVYTVAAGKTVTFANGTIWSKRSRVVVNGTLEVKAIHIGHEASGTYPGRVTIANGGTLKTQSVTFRNFGGSTNSGLELQAGGTLEFTQNSSSALALSANGTATYEVVLNGGTVKAADSSWKTDSTVNVTVGGATTFDVAANKEIAIASTISGSGAITKTGTGTLTLSGANSSYTGAVAVNAGTLSVGSASALGTGTVTVAADATLDLGSQRSVSMGSLAGSGTVYALLTDAETTGTETSLTLFTLTGTKADTVQLEVRDAAGHIYDVTVSEGSYTVDPTKPGNLAKIGETGYDEVNKAFTAVQDGETIILQADASDSKMSTDKACTLDLNGKTLTGSLAISKTDTSTGAVTMKLNSGTFGATVTGGGTLVYDSTIVTTFPSAPAGLTAEAWTGTVYLNGYTGQYSFDLSGFGNAKSTVKLTGFTGYSGSNTTGSFAGTLELADNGETIAFMSSDGYNSKYSFGALTGDGTFLLNGTQNANSQYRFVDASAFTGTLKITQGNKRLVIGSDTSADAGNGQILVNAGATAQIASEKTWTASSGIVVNGTIGGAGTLASNTTFGDGATIDVSSGKVLTANGTLTFGANTKVKVSAAPAAGSPVKVISKADVGQSVIDATLKVYVGDEEQTGTYLLIYNSDGVYAALKQNIAATLTDDTNWSTLATGGFWDAYTITGDGHALILDSIVNLPNVDLTLTGQITLKAADSLYEDGCWEKTLATFKSITTTGTITDSLKDGFYGAFTVGTATIKLRAQNKEVISINIAGGTSTSDTSPDANKVTGSSYYGLAPTIGSSWNNIDGQFQSTKTITIKSPNAYDGNQTIQRPTMDLSATGKNTWQASLDNPFLRGYLDDGGGVSVGVHGIPYTKYDVIVYATSDRSDTGIAPIEVNGTKYSYVDGVVTASDTAWGQGMQATPEFGKNAILITDCTGESLTINASRKGYTGSGTGRATLCAVQVINKGEVVIKSEYYGDVNGDATWTNGENDENITKTGTQGWGNSTLSTLTFTNKATSATLTFGAATTGQVFKVVSEAGCKLTIAGASLANFNFSMVDLSEAAGGVSVDLTGVAIAEEKTLVTWTSLSGSLTFNYSGDWGAYADSTGIHTAHKATGKYTNPVTGEEDTFGNVFFGKAGDGAWANQANWRTLTTGDYPIWALYSSLGKAKAPAMSDHGGDYWKAMLDGTDTDNKTVTCSETLNGWHVQFGVCNGISATVALGKLQRGDGDSTVGFFWVDDTSSLTISSVGGTRNMPMNFYVAAKNGLTFSSEWNASVAFSYYLAGEGSVKYTAGVTAGTHTLKQFQLLVGAAEKTAHHLARQTLVSFASNTSTPTFSWADATIKTDNENVTLTLKTAIPSVMDAVGSYYIVQESDGVYAYVVQYADAWDIVDPLAVTLAANSTTDWSKITWSDANNNTFTGLTDAHTYNVTAGDKAELTFDVATSATAINLVNSSDETVTLKKGDTIDAPTINYTQVAGVADIAWTAASLVSSSCNVRYSGGAGTADSRVAIDHAGGTLNLVGGTYHLAYSVSETATTVNMTDVTADYVIPSGQYYSFALGTATYTLDGSTVVTTPSLWLSQGADSRTASLTIKGNAEVKVTGETNEDTNHSTIMIGHWNGASTLTLEGNGKLTAEKAQLLVGKTHNNQTINVNGGTLTAKGIKLSGQASGTNALNLNGGELVLGDVGITSYDASCTMPITVGGAAKITSSAAMTISQPLTVNADKTLTLDATSGTIKLTGTVANSGTIHVAGGTLDIGTMRGVGAMTFADGAVLAMTETYADDSVLEPGFSIPAGTKVTVTRLDGTTETVTVSAETAELDLTPVVSGKACWYDFTFTNTLKSVGTETGTLTRDTSFGLGAATNAYTSTSNAIFTAIDGYMAPTYPTEWSASVFATMPKVKNAILMAFGTKADGAIALIAGDTTKDQVLLVRTTGDSAYETLATMTVPNAYTTSHLYSFCKTDKKITIYLDSTLWTVYTSESSITFGSGFQLGSLHGGIGSTGFVQYGNAYYDAETEANNSTIAMLRMFKAELGPNAIAELARQFQYESPNGTYTRTIEDSSAAWVSEEGTWAKGSESLVTAPAAKGTVILTAGVATTVSVNLDDDVSYESVTFAGNGTASLTLNLAEGKKAIKMSQVTINTALTLGYGAADLSGAVTSFGANGSLTVNFSGLDCKSVKARQVEKVTGTCADATLASRIHVIEPANTYGRKFTVEYLTDTKTYAVVIDIDPEISALYWNKDNTVFNDDTTFLDAAGTKTVAYYPGLPIAVNHDSTISEIAEAYLDATYEVLNGATLTRNALSNDVVTVKNGGKLLLSIGAGNIAVASPTITIEEGGAFDNSGWLTVNGTMTITNATDVSVLDNSASGWGPSCLEGSGKIVKAGAGKLTLQSSVNMESGTIQVDAGTLVLAEKSAASNEIENKIGTVTAAGAVEKSHDGVLTVGNASTFDGGLTVSAGTIKFAGDSATKVTGLYGAGTVEITGAGNLIVNKDSTGYSIKNTTVKTSSGTIWLGHSSTCDGSKLDSAKFVLEGGTIDLYGWSTWDTDCTIENASEVKAFTTANTANSVQGSGKLVKNGTGKLTFNSNFDLAGATINAGSVALDTNRTVKNSGKTVTLAAEGVYFDAPIAATNSVTATVTAEGCSLDTSMTSDRVVFRAHSDTKPISPAPGGGTIVISEEVTSAITVEPGVSLKVPTATSSDNIQVKYVDTSSVTHDLKGDGYVTVSVGDTGVVTLTATEKAKPTPTAMGTGDDEGSVKIDIGTPVPGLFYVVHASTKNDFSDLTASTITSGETTQATASSAHTVSVTPPTGSNVIYFKVEVKASK